MRLSGQRFVGGIQMQDMAQFRQLLIELCQAPLPEARRLLRDHPELLGGVAEQHLSMLVEVTGERGDWRSQATFRKARALVGHARMVGVETAVGEAEAAERGELPEELTALPFRAAEAASNYERSGSVANLTEEIASWEAVLRHPVVDRAHPGLRWAALLDSAAARLARWEHTGDVSDLDIAIERWRQILLEMAPGAPAAALTYNNLAVAHLLRYGVTGTSSDLAEAVAAADNAVTVAADDDEQLPKFLADLAGALQERYAATGDLSDLHRAIRLYEDAVGRLAPGAEDENHVLNNFVTALRDRFERTGDPADQAEAERLRLRLRNATASGPVYRARHLSNQATYAATTTELIEIRRQAVAMDAENSSLRAAHLYNLATSLLDDYLQTFDHGSLDEAINEFENAIDAAGPGSPDLARYYLGCGKARRLAFVVADDYEEQVHELMRGTDVLEGAVALGLDNAPDIALEAARFAGDWHAEIENWDQAAMTYRRGLDAADRLLRVQLRRAHKETWLHTIGDLPSHAAYATAQTGDIGAAALALERGRAILLTEALDLRDVDVDRLRAEGQEELSTRFHSLVARWNEL